MNIAYIIPRKPYEPHDLSYQTMNSYPSAAPEINISPVPDIVSDSQHFVPVICDSCRSSVYDILLKFENLPVIVTGRK